MPFVVGCSYMKPTTKPPDRCPLCNAPSSQLTTRGVRRRKHSVVQLYRCKKCERTFTPGPRALASKVFPVQTVLAAITLYNRGYSLTDTCTKISRDEGHKVSTSTLSRWLAQYSALASYQRLRTLPREPIHNERYSPTAIIKTLKLYHKQVYEFAYHRGKLALLLAGALDDKRASSGQQSSSRFAPVVDFLASVPTATPHDLFRSESGARGSQLAKQSKSASRPAGAGTGTSLDTQQAPQADASFVAPFINLNTLEISEKKNVATDTAGLIIPSVGSNHDRHPKLQRFMLANDSTTIAIEVPIWLTESEIDELEREHGIAFVPKTGTPRHVTGHIDFLQVRNGALHILDYKPGARTDKPVTQLTLYALALTKRIDGLKLFDIKCAWFDEHVYNEFFPRLALKRTSTRA